MRYSAASVCLLAMLLAAPSALAQGYSDEDVRRIMVEESVRSFRGDCPCPYSYGWNGRQCANQSAYTRLGVAGPTCYGADISQSQVEDYRRRNRLKR